MQSSAVKGPSAPAEERVQQSCGRNSAPRGGKTSAGSHQRKFSGRQSAPPESPGLSPAFSRIPIASPHNGRHPRAPQHPAILVKPSAAAAAAKTRHRRNQRSPGTRSRPRRRSRDADARSRCHPLDNWRSATRHTAQMPGVRRSAIRSRAAHRARSTALRRPATGPRHANILRTAARPRFKRRSHPLRFSRRTIRRSRGRSGLHVRSRYRLQPRTIFARDHGLDNDCSPTNLRTSRNSNKQLASTGPHRIAAAHH